MTLNENIMLPVRTDLYGLYIFDAEGKMLAQIRGYGWLKVLFGEELVEAKQIELANWIVKKINE